MAKFSLTTKLFRNSPDFGRAAEVERAGR